MTISLSLGSLFDGIGGFPLAGVRQGLTPAWASEIEPFPIEVTKIWFPEMLHVGDITQLKGSELAPVDIVCGGSPCQDLSVAGKRAGLQGERSGLFMEQIRIIKELREHDARTKRTDDPARLRPRYMVWENVPGAFSSADGEDFRAVLEETCRIADSTVSVPRPPRGIWRAAGAILGSQFSLAWRIYDAQYWSVPQRRKRIYLVADFGGHTAPQILFKQNSLFGDTPSGEEAGQGAASCAEAGAGNPGGSPIQIENTEAVAFACNQRDEVRDLHDVSGAIQAQPGMKQQTLIARLPDEVEASESGTNMAQSILCLNDQGGERMDVTENITATLRAQMDGHPPLVLGDPPELFENHAIDARYTGPHKVSPTISARSGTGGNNLPLISQNAETYCIAGNIIDRQDHNGGNGMGCQPDISYTVTATDRLSRHPDNRSNPED